MNSVRFIKHQDEIMSALKDFEKLESLMDSGRVVSYTEFKKLEIRDRSIVEEASEFVTAKAKYTVMQVRKRLKG